MTPSSFETLCQLLVRSDHIPKGNAFGRRCIDPEKQIAVAEWALANQESCRQISDRFNVTMSSGGGRLFCEPRRASILGDPGAVS